MAPSKLFFLFSLILFFLQPSTTDGICPTGCGPVPILFPFQMSTSLPENRCGCPGFTVICKNETQNILTFPLSGEFRIQNIDYLSQVVWLSDPNDCTAERLLQGFDYWDTPFQPLYTRNYTFFNCTADSPILQIPRATTISCLSSGSYYVVALPTADISNDSNTPGCLEIATVLYPTDGDAWGDSLGDFIKLTWKELDCQWCESIGGVGRFKNDAGLDVGYVKPSDHDHGPSFYAKFFELFVVASGLGIIGLIICVRRSIKHHAQHEDEISNSTILQGNVVAKGLDRPTIEMYPTTMLGESLQLPKSTDNVCPICLIEYQAKDILRTIPSCLHYFHVDCIDEWLERNATCPVCRN